MQAFSSLLFSPFRFSEFFSPTALAAARGVSFPLVSHVIGVLANTAMQLQTSELAKRASRGPDWAEMAACRDHLRLGARWGCWSSRDGWQACSAVCVCVWSSSVSQCRCANAPVCRNSPYTRDTRHPPPESSRSQISLLSGLSVGYSSAPN